MGALDVLERGIDRARLGKHGVIATVIARHGSAPGSPGQKLYLGDDGVAFGTVGGGALEKSVIRELADRLESREHGMKTFKLGAELGMCCGGQIDLVFEPIAARTPCLLVGGGHVARATAPLLVRAGFAVTVIDARAAWGNERPLENVTVLTGEYDDLDLPQETIVLVMTHDHGLDQRAIEWALRKGFAFVGGIGSRAKAKRTQDRLEHKGFPEADRSRVRMPLGIDIGARLPDEIAISVAAELIQFSKSREKAARGARELP